MFDEPDEVVFVEPIEDEPALDECLEECCPMCNGEAYSLGALGWTQYYRCVHCGWQFSA